MRRAAVATSFSSSGEWTLASWLMGTPKASRTIRAEPWRSLTAGRVTVMKKSMGPATAMARFSTRRRARDLGTSSPRRTWK